MSEPPLPANRRQNVLRRVNRARDFPVNTCGASRHLQRIGEALSCGRPYPMLDEEPEHCGLTMLSVVESLFKARTLLLKHGISPSSGHPTESPAHAAWVARVEAQIKAAFAARESTS
jgi:hypothetical protein